jgi:hypothetical protein
MNHKRRGPKSTRAGCMMCKAHKHQGGKDVWNNQTIQEKRSRLNESEQLSELECTVDSCPKESS